MTTGRPTLHTPHTLETTPILALRAEAEEPATRLQADPPNINLALEVKPRYLEIRQRQMVITPP